MHTYSINSTERKTIPFFFAGLSIGIILILKNNVHMPSWVPVPSVFALYGIFYKVFENWIWKWQWVYDCGVVNTPNLNGEWEMISKSSLHNYEREYKGILSITQTWTEISIHLDGEKFVGDSTMAGFTMRTNNSFTLKWEYLSQKKPEFSEQDYMHYGMTRIMKNGNEEPMKLSGDYYTDKSRHAYGSVMVIKKGLVSLPK